jgi:hypothetical protein
LIYFCIPTLNEERTVGVVLWKLRQVMSEMQRDFQIIVVDDASTDRTAEVLNPYTRVLPLTLFRNEKTMGYAASLEMAIREATRRSPYPKRDAVITLQADFTEDPDVVAALVKRIEAGADLVAAQPTFDGGVPANVRRGRRFFNWLVKGREWTQVADPFCGVRAYRVMTLKRALETRGTARLLSWEGWAANAELLMQTLPHARRSDAIEMTSHYTRLQRPSRFRFLAMLSQVLGVRGGKQGPAEPVQIPQAVVALPTPPPVELVPSKRRDEGRRRPDARRSRPVAGRGERERPSNEGKRTRTGKPRRQKEATVTPITAALDTAAAPPTEEQRAKRRRRPRKRSRKPTQRTDQPPLTLETVGNGNGVAEVVTAAADAGEAAAPAPRKKSRRGRRGGRGRKRGPRPNAEGSNENQVDLTPDNAGEAAS